MMAGSGRSRRRKSEAARDARDRAGAGAPLPAGRFSRGLAAALSSSSLLSLAGMAHSGDTAPGTGCRARAPALPAWPASCRPSGRNAAPRRSVDAEPGGEPRRDREPRRPDVGASGERGAFPRPDRRARRSRRASRPRRPDRLRQQGVRGSRRASTSGNWSAGRCPISASRSAWFPTPPSPMASA